MREDRETLNYQAYEKSKLKHDIIKELDSYKLSKFIFPAHKMPHVLVHVCCCGMH